MAVDRVALEIAVASAADARRAAAAGADRVELSSALELGGLTPSAAELDAAVAGGLPVQVLIRCRAGGFVYDDDELAVMAEDARRAVSAGAAGVVIGALTAQRELAIDALRRLTEAARGARSETEVTLHRAVDHAADPIAAVRSAAELGFARVLTSGAAPRARDGLGTLREMVAAAEGRVGVLAGAGVRADDVEALVAAGVSGVHLSATRALDDATGVPLGSDGGLRRLVLDETVVRGVRRAIDGRGEQG